METQLGTGSNSNTTALRVQEPMLGVCPSNRQPTLMVELLLRMMMKTSGKCMKSL